MCAEKKYLQKWPKTAPEDTFEFPISMWNRCFFYQVTVRFLPVWESEILRFLFEKKYEFWSKLKNEMLLLTRKKRLNFILLPRFARRNPQFFLPARFARRRKFTTKLFIVFSLELYLNSLRLIYILKFQALFFKLKCTGPSVRACWSFSIFSFVVQNLKISILFLF